MATLYQSLICEGYHHQIGYYMNSILFVTFPKMIKKLLSTNYTQKTTLTRNETA